MASVSVHCMLPPQFTVGIIDDSLSRPPTSTRRSPAHIYNCISKYSRPSTKESATHHTLRHELCFYPHVSTQYLCAPRHPHLPFLASSSYPQGPQLTKSILAHTYTHAHREIHAHTDRHTSRYLRAHKVIRSPLSLTPLARVRTRLNSNLRQKNWRKISPIFRRYIIAQPF